MGIFRYAMAIFAFVVMVGSLIIVIIDRAFGIPVDPIASTILVASIGYAFSQLGNYQGVVTAQSIQHIAHEQELQKLSTEKQQPSTEAKEPEEDHGGNPSH